MIDEKKLIEEFNIKSIKYDDMCGDAIEENDCGMQMIYAGKGLAYVEAIKIVEKQPKVGEWIPCSKCLPERDGTYQLKEFAVTIDNGEHVYASHASYDFYNEKWLVHKSKVIAWMPLPEPYRPEKE